MTSPAKYSLVTDAGPTAPWLVLVHGISQDHRVFDRQVSAFRASHRLILIDLPGHGLSADIPGPYGIEAFAAAIEGAIGDAGAENATYWGTHLGAAAGLVLACQKPALFNALILEGPVFPGRAIPSVSDFLTKVAATAKQDGIATARDLWWHEGGWFDMMRSDPVACRADQHRVIIDDFGGGPWLEAGLASKPMPPLEDVLSALSLPILIMNGEHDLPDFLDAAEALADLIPDCRRASIPNGGGFPFWERPEAVNAVADDFLSNTP